MTLPSRDYISKDQDSKENKYV